MKRIKVLLMACMIFLSITTSLQAEYKPLFCNYCDQEVEALMKENKFELKVMTVDNGNGLKYVNINKLNVIYKDVHVGRLVGYNNGADVIFIPCADITSCVAMVINEKLKEIQDQI